MFSCLLFKANNFGRTSKILGWEYAVYKVHLNIAINVLGKLEIHIID